MRPAPLRLTARRVHGQWLLLPQGGGKTHPGCVTAHLHRSSGRCRCLCYHVEFVYIRITGYQHWPVCLLRVHGQQRPLPLPLGIGNHSIQFQLWPCRLLCCACKRFRFFFFSAVILTPTSGHSLLQGTVSVITTDCYTDLMLYSIRL